MSSRFIDESVKSSSRMNHMHIEARRKLESCIVTEFFQIPSQGRFNVD